MVSRLRQATPVVRHIWPCKAGTRVYNAERSRRQQAALIEQMGGDVEAVLGSA